MTDLAVVVPTRGRPGAARVLAEAFQRTCTGGTTLVFAVNDDDPAADEYLALSGDGVAVRTSPARTMVEALNDAARDAAPGAFAVGFLGDDHLPRTVGWDALYVEALRDLGTGIVYGNDLLQGRNLPTQCAMTSDIVRALGWMAPPVLKHLYVDNFWMQLGHQVPCIRYLPRVVVEHVHPLAGKAAWDEGYARVNDSALYAADEAAYGRFAAAVLPAAISAVRGLLRPADAAPEEATVGG